MKPSLSIQEFDYSLPPERIAAFPLAQRDASRLLVYRNGTIQDDTFSHLPGHLPAGSTLVLNNTRVIEARILFQKESGGTIEIFCLEPSDQSMELAMAARHTCRWKCLIGGASKWKAGQQLRKVVFIEGVPVELTARYEARTDDGFTIQFSWHPDHPFAAVLQQAGAMPLPPYIKRKAVDTDHQRYQTVFAEQKGSVAAPTASLHFTDQVFRELEAKNIRKAMITLHVGAGTFKPVKTDNIADHAMHAESFMVRAETLEQLMAAETIVAAGTTSLRTLESLHWLGVKQLRQPGVADFSLAQWEAYELMEPRVPYSTSIEALLRYMKEREMNELWCRTSLLIVPGYPFASAAALVTNFHQPCSTLLLLVAAFIGEDWKKTYQHALAHDYRFLSYGDSSLLWRRDELKG